MSAIAVTVSPDWVVVCEISSKITAIVRAVQKKLRAAGREDVEVRVRGGEGGRADAVWPLLLLLLLATGWQLLLGHARGLDSHPPIHSPVATLTVKRAPTPAG